MQENNIPVVPIVLALFAIVGLVLLIGMTAFIGFLISRAVKRRSYDTERGRQMQDTARSNGFAFQAEAKLEALPFFSGFELFEGSPVGIENLITGRSGREEIAVFDLVYRNVGGSYGGGTTTSRQTMAAVVSVDLELPQFQLRPEGSIERVLNAVSRVDIDFAERHDFSRKFLLYGNDETAIRQLFDAAKLDFFEQNPVLCVVGSRNTIILYSPRSVAHPGQIGQYVSFATHLCELFGR